MADVCNTARTGEVSNTATNSITESRLDVGYNFLAHHLRRILHPQMGKSLVGDFFQNFDFDIMLAMEIQAVLWQGFPGAADGHCQDGQLHLVGQDKRPGFEGFHCAGFRPCAFGKKEYRTPLDKRFLTGLHHTPDAFLVPPFESDITIENHVPPDKRQLEDLGLGDPLEREEQPEGDQNIQLGLVVGNDDIVGVPPYFIAADGFHGPGRHGPEVKAGPEGGKHVQHDQPPVERTGQ